MWKSLNRMKARAGYRLRPISATLFQQYIIRTYHHCVARVVSRTCQLHSLSTFELPSRSSPSVRVNKCTSLLLLPKHHNIIHTPSSQSTPLHHGRTKSYPIHRSSQLDPWQPPSPQAPHDRSGDLCLTNPYRRPLSAQSSSRHCWSSCRVQEEKD